MPHLEAPSPVKPIDWIDTIECPCCKGEGHLTVHDDVLARTQLTICTHCMGAGKVPAQ